MKINTIFWLIYLALVILAITFNGTEHPFISEGPYATGKYLAWMAFLAFTGYSYYCSQKENLFKTIKTMLGLHWGRQIVTDLYIGLTLFIIFIFVHQDSVLVSVLWAIPALYFVNLTSLLYLALHYDSVVSFLVG